MTQQDSIRDKLDAWIQTVNTLIFMCEESRMKGYLQEYAVGVKTVWRKVYAIPELKKDLDKGLKIINEASNKRKQVKQQAIQRKATSQMDESIRTTGMQSDELTVYSDNVLSHIQTVLDDHDMLIRRDSGDRGAF